MTIIREKKGNEMAGKQGFEPQFHDPESCVYRILESSPLHSKNQNIHV